MATTLTPDNPPPTPLESREGAQHSGLHSLIQLCSTLRPVLAQALMSLISFRVSRPLSSAVNT